MKDMKTFSVWMIGFFLMSGVEHALSQNEEDGLPSSGWPVGSLSASVGMNDFHVKDRYLSPVVSTVCCLHRGSPISWKPNETGIPSMLFSVPERLTPIFSQEMYRRRWDICPILIRMNSIPGNSPDTPLCYLSAAGSLHSLRIQTFLPWMKHTTTPLMINPGIGLIH